MDWGVLAETRPEPVPTVLQPIHLESMPPQDSMHGPTQNLHNKLYLKISYPQFHCVNAAAFSLCYT